MSVPREENERPRTRRVELRVGPACQLGSEPESHRITAVRYMRTLVPASRAEGFLDAFADGICGGLRVQMNGDASCMLACTGVCTGGYGWGASGP